MKVDHLINNKEKKVCVFCKKTSGLDEKGMQSHLHTPAQALLKTHVWYVACLK